MKRMIAVGLLLAGCSQPHDEAFFRANESERVAKVTECLALDSLAFQKSAECVAAVVAEPYYPHEYWQAHRDQRMQWMKLCRSVGMPTRQSDVCISAAKSSMANMGGGTPIYPTSWKLPPG